MPHSTPQRDHATPQRILILATGGTISCTQNPDGHLIPTLNASDLINRAQLPQTHPTIEFLGIDALHLDSSALQLADIDTLLQLLHSYQHPNASTEQPTGIIITHGTDTLEETAMAADQLLPPGPAVIFTGAQHPADSPQADGFANLRSAIEILLHGQNSPTSHRTQEPPLGYQRPQVVFGHHRLPAFGVTKINTHDHNAFAYTHPVEEDIPMALSPAERANLRTPPPIAGLHVPIISTYAGDDGQLLNHVLSAQAPHHNGEACDGAIIEALGSGNVPPAVMKVIQKATVPIVVCTRVPFGGVHFIYGGPGGGATLASAGVLSGGSLRPAQARMALLGYLARQRVAHT